jgi:hypothetical protein
VQPNNRTSVFSFDQPIFGFGGLLRSGGFGSLSFTLNFADGSTQVLDPQGVNPSWAYFGFNSDVGFQSITVKPAATSQVLFYMDDLTIGEGVAAVPEPATWGMMIVGFAVIGSTMRRQRPSRVSFA